MIKAPLTIKGIEWRYESWTFTDAQGLVNRLPGIKNTKRKDDGTIIDENRKKGKH